jgi:transposase
MAKKRRKVYRKTKTGWKELSPYLRRKAERERQERAEPEPKPKRISVLIREEMLRPMIREAARAGLVEAIEHSHNFWNVGEGYKKYIEQQVAAHAEALLAAVRIALRDELTKLRTVKLRTRKH